MTKICSAGATVSPLLLVLQPKCGAWVWKPKGQEYCSKCGNKFPQLVYHQYLEALPTGEAAAAKGMGKGSQATAATKGSVKGGKAGAGASSAITTWSPDLLQYPHLPLAPGAQPKSVGLQATSSATVWSTQQLLDKPFSLVR